MHHTTLLFSIGSRSVFVRSSFGPRSSFVHLSFILRSSFVHPSFGIRSGFVRDSFGIRRTIKEATKKQRKCIWGKTEAKRSQNEGKTEPKRKGLLLPFKTIRFAYQKDSFYSPKRLLLDTKRTTFGIRSFEFWISALRALGFFEFVIESCLLIQHWTTQNRQSRPIQNSKLKIQNSASP